MDTARPHRTEDTPRVAVVGYGLGGRVFHVPVAAEAGLEVSHVVTSNPERAAQVLLDHLVDGLPRRLGNPVQVDRDRLFDGGELAGPRPQQQVIRHKRRRLGALPVVPLFQVAVEALAILAGQLIARDHLQGDADVAARREEDQVGGHPEDGLDRSGAERGAFAGPRVGEHASPEPDRADEYDVRLGDALEDFISRPGGPDQLRLLEADLPGGIDQEALAAAEPFDDRVDHRQGPLVGGPAVLGQVGHLQGVDQPHQRAEQRNPVDAGIHDRAERASEPQVGDHQGRIDIGGMAGHDQRWPVEPLQLPEPRDLDAIAPVEHPANDRPEQSVHET